MQMINLVGDFLMHKLSRADRVLHEICTMYQQMYDEAYTEVA